MTISSEIVDLIRNEIGKINVLIDPELLKNYSTDQSIAKGVEPQLVVLPENTEMVSKIMKICYDFEIPITARSAGTGLVGGAIPTHGGIVMDMKKMNRIVQLDEANFQITVEPAIITEELQNFVKTKGLYYPPDPSSRGSSFIGGNVASNAGGPRAVKYGVVREYVLNLEVVLPDGNVIWTGANTLKNSTGYSLTQLMIGSEGTLGIITKIVLKLIPHPTHDLLLLAPFYSVKEATKAVSTIFKSGITPSAIELMDRKAIDWASDYLGRDRMDIDEKVKAQLLIEVDGFDLIQLQKECEKIYEVLLKFEIGEILFADSAAQKDELWKLRRNIANAVKVHKIYKKEDTVVPRDNMPLLLEEIEKLEKKYGFDAICFGHAGDGNLHINIVQGDKSDEEVINWHAAIVDLVLIVKRLGGTLSGEHGIGIVQKEFLPLILDQKNLDIMKGIKNVFDPKNILNPEKIF